jgi:DNA polymerase-3 subunit delta
MLYILHGQDDASREAYIQKLAAQSGAMRVDYSLENPPGGIDTLLAQDLFSGSQAVVLGGLLQTLLTETTIPQLKATANLVVFCEESLDKRLKLVKQLLEDKEVVVREFAVPDQAKLPAWVENKVGERGGRIAKDAVLLLLQHLGYINPLGGSELALAEVSLARLDSEISKLLTYAAGDVISKAAVAELVADSREVVGFALSDAVAKKNRKEIFSLLETYYAGSNASDVQGKTIMLAALLADQFRSMLTVLEGQALGMSDEQIAAPLGWKSGRVFVMKKMASNFTRVSLRELLQKLENLDVELKTSSLPPRVVLELILAQS